MAKISYEISRTNDTGLQGTLLVGTTASELKVGSLVKDNRASVTLYNNSSVIMYWGYTSDVLSTTGTPIVPNQFVVWEVEYGDTIYVVAATNNNDARITEGI